MAQTSHPSLPPVNTAGGVVVGEQGPAASWEVAYVYAFLLKFTTLRNLTSTQTLLTTPMALEEALLASSPSPPPPPPARVVTVPTVTSSRPNSTETIVPGSPASSLSSLSDVDSLSSLSDVEDEVKEPEPVRNSKPLSRYPIPSNAAIPDSSPLVVQIIKEFKSNLTEAVDSGGGGGGGRKKENWFKWMVKWVDARLKEEDTGGLEWYENLLKVQGDERETRWWLLHWADKIHLLRVMVDHQLVSSSVIRDLIAQNYDIGHQRVTKRDPKINPLVIEKAGALAKGEIWHLDDSPRLYHQGNPFKYDASWTPLTSTVEEFQAYVDTLPKPEVEVLAGPFQKAKDDAKIANNNKKPKAKGKGKGKGDDPSSDESEDEVTKKERATRKVLEVDLPLVLEAQEAIEALAAKKIKAAERAADRDARVARNLSKLGSLGVATRERRLRTQTRTVDYVYDAEYDEESGEDDYKMEQGSETLTRGGLIKGKKRSRVVESDDEGEEDDNGEWEEDEEEGKQSRQSSRAPGSVVLEWRGERRSNRIQIKETVDADEDATPELDLGWSRSISSRLPPRGKRPQNSTIDDPTASSAAPSAVDRSSSPSRISETTGSSSPTEQDLDTMVVEEDTASKDLPGAENGMVVTV